MRTHSKELSLITGLFLGLTVLMVPANNAEAQISRAINNTVGTWYAPEAAVERGFPSRITINRISGATVGNRTCKWKSEQRTVNRLAFSQTSPAAVIDCPNMEEIVVTPETLSKWSQDEVYVQFGGSGRTFGYRYASAAFLEEQKRARESPPQRWGQ